MTTKKDNASAGMDLSGLAELDTIEVQIDNPVNGGHVIDANGKPWTWTLAGPAHDATLKFRRRVDILSQKWARMKEKERDAQEYNDSLRAAYALRVIDWTPIVMDGEGFECTRQNAEKLMTDQRYNWLYKQITALFGEQDTFLPKGSTD